MLLHQTFTLENTEGFRAHELLILNNAVADLRDIASFSESDIEDASIVDAITNAWLDNATVEEIVSAARARLGL